MYVCVMAGNCHPYVHVNGEVVSAWDGSLAEIRLFASKWLQLESRILVTLNFMIGDLGRIEIYAEM